MRKAFSMIELVFVIVIMGILAKFGTNILMTTYTSYTASTTNNKLLANTELTLKQISNRLQYRIKDSVISGNGAAFSSLLSAAGNDTVLEWIGYDIDGLLGTAGSTNPTWSGFIDVNDQNAVDSQVTATPYLSTPGSNTANINAVIQALSPTATDISNTAIFFTGENTDVTTDYGWYAGALTNQNNVAAHRVILNAGSAERFTSGAGVSFAGTDIYENYKLAWTAYALSFENIDAADGVGDLFLYYDYQPWEGDNFNAGTKVLLLQGLDTFRFTAIGDIIKIQICVNDKDALGAGDGGYSVCEETAIF